MKRAAPILLLAMAITASPLLSQTNTQLSASDACPTWNKKQPGSKADYFAYLRKRPGSSDNPYRQYSNAPGYQPANTALRSTHTTSQDAFRSEPQNTSATRLTEGAPQPVKQHNITKKTQAKTDETATASIAKKADSPTAKPETTPVAKPETPAVKPEEKAAPVAKAPEEKTAKAASTKTLSASTALSKKKTPALKKDKGVRMKKTKFKKNRATKCPDF